MRKLLLILICMLGSIGTWAQEPDANLMKRLNEYMILNKELNFKKMMDYVHPRLFKLAPKEVIVSVFEEAMDNEVMKMDFDSMRITQIGPEFKVGDTIYRKIDYYMEARMMMKDSTTWNDPEFIELMTEGLKEGFPDGKINYDTLSHEFSIKAGDILFAIRDSPSTDWFFLGYDNNEEQVLVLFPKSVIVHYKLLN